MRYVAYDGKESSVRNEMVYGNVDAVPSIGTIRDEENIRSIQTVWSYRTNEIKT